MSPNPKTTLATQLASYQLTWDQKYLLAMLQGIIADNIANDGGDMVRVIYSDIASPLDANLPSNSALSWAMQTMGDQRGVISTIIAHSTTTANLEEIDPDGFVTDKNQVLGLAPPKYYRGKLYIEDDTCTVVPGTNSDAYYTYLVGPGAIGWAPAPLPTDSKASVVTRSEESGNGGGASTHHYRWAKCINFYGFSNLLPGGKGGTALREANLKLATTWDRMITNRNNVRLCALVHNNITM